VAGLAHLLRAFDYAADAGGDPWEFAVEIGDLRAAGMTASEFRWLVAKGIVQHGHETSLYGDTHRTFRSCGGLTFLETTSFILTPAGAALVRDSLVAAADVSPPPAAGAAPEVAASFHVPTTVIHGPHRGPDVRPRILQPADALQLVARRFPPDLTPIWEARTRELRVGGLLVKQFRVPASNQEYVLSAFQEEDWPPCIDDPLPMKSEISPKRRLHNVINRLNGRQVVPVLRFHGTGNGEGIAWEFLPQPLAHQANGPAHPAANADPIGGVYLG